MPLVCMAQPFIVAGNDCVVGVTRRHSGRGLGIHFLGVLFGSGWSGVANMDEKDLIKTVRRRFPFPPKSPHSGARAAVPGVQINMRIETCLMDHLRLISSVRLAKERNDRRILGTDGASAIRLLQRW